MKKEDLFNTIRDIDDKYLEIADNYKGKAKRPVWVKWVATAACLSLVVGAVSMMPSITNPKSDEGFVQEMNHQGKEENGILGDENSTNDVTPNVDQPVQNEVDKLDAYDSVWGGSYVDENGQWVVLLTDNTDANQKLVIEKNPNLSNGNVKFKTAEFSLAYLNELMDSINEGISSGELSFVTGAMLVEQKNQIEVFLNTNTSEAESKVLSLDKKGGAIIINYSDADGVEDLGRN